MKAAVEKAFLDVANQFMVPDEERDGEWKCRLCTGMTLADGPVLHAPDCALTVLYEALETSEDPK